MPLKDWERKIHQVLHETKIELPESDNPSIFPPLYDSVKYTFENSDDVLSLFNNDRTGYLYSRYSNPNCDHLSRIISKITGKENTILTPNGLSAINLSLEALSYPGACIMYFSESYAPTKNLIRNTYSKWGIESVFCNIDDHDKILELFEDNSPDILIFESPTNPQLKIADIEFLLDLCQKYNCKSILDNTFAGLHQHDNYDIDVVIHSLSKFASGHGDIMGGSVSVNSSSLFEEMQSLAHAKAINMEPNTARNFVKSLQTYPIRYKKYSKNAFHLAKALEEENCFPQTIFPGLKSHPEYDLAIKQQISPGNVIYVELPEGVQVYRFIDALKIFKMSPSLGSNESLVAPALAFYGHGMSEEEKQSANIEENRVRFSIGLEDPDLLLEDIMEALKLQGN
jgi:cystathionine beta-lyase/cystathionine gamma-synthase